MIKKLLLILAVFSLALAVISCTPTDKPQSEEGGSEEISLGESIELGEEITGKPADFLKAINDAISLSDGVTKYTLVASVKTNDVTVTAQTIELVISKTDGRIDKFHVKTHGLDAYYDFEYVYVTEHGAKIRLLNDPYDMEEYIEDVEEPYYMNDIDSIKAYKDGYLKQYLIRFKEEYILDEFDELLDEIGDVIVKDCTSTVMVSSNSMAEIVELKIVSRGKEYTVTASRQSAKGSSSDFPDFSEYKDPESNIAVLSEIDQAIENTKELTSYKKTVTAFGGNTGSFTYQNSNGNLTVSANTVGESYYKDGKTYYTYYSYPKNHKVYKIVDFDEYYSALISEMPIPELVDPDLGIVASHLEFVSKSQSGQTEVYTLLLNKAGVDYLESLLDEYFIDSVTVVYTVNGGVINLVEIVEGDSYAKLLIEKDITPQIPDLSAYKPIIEDTNTLTGIKSTGFEEYQLDYDTFVTPTGDIYMMSDYRDAIKRYNNRHELVKEYEIEVANGYNFGSIVGVNEAYIYYTAFESYYHDYSEDNKLYSLNMSTGECRCEESNYGYDKMVVAVYGYNIIRSNYRGAANGSQLSFITEGFRETYFIHYDTTDSLIIFDGYGTDGKTYLCAYDLKTDTVYKEAVEGFHRNEDYFMGEGYLDFDGFYHEFSRIGRSKTVSYLSVIDKRSDRYYESEIDANWQIVKTVGNYVFTTMGVYDTVTGRCLYFPEKAEYRFFSGGVHIWAYDKYDLDDKILYTIYF